MSLIVRSSGVSLTAALIATLAIASCTGADGKDGANGANGTDGTDGVDGADGENGTSCTVTDNNDGTKTITCEDGTTVTVSDGADGSCTVVDNGDGTKTITCDDGTSVTVSDGETPLGEGETPGLIVSASASAPANGTHFVAGEQIALTITLTDNNGYPVTLDDMNRLRLYMNGPRDVTATVTPVELLDTSADRTASPHHYADLADSANDNVSVAGNVVTFTSEAITDEDPGTYTMGVYARRNNPYSADQAFELVDVQIGTATVEPLIVGNCEDCHKGAATDVTYLHHIDNGSVAIDAVPVRTCKNCHNQEGYAAVRVCPSDGSKPQRIDGVYTCADGSTDYTYRSDSIVRRVHGLHNGNHLLSEYNTNEDWGDFHDYTHLHFPADIKNCTKCHLDDSWKNKPSREACGACHDNLDFATGTFAPYKVGGPGGCANDSDCLNVFSGVVDGSCNVGTGMCELRNHTPGPQSNDDTCAICHTSGEVAIDAIHTVAPPVFPHTISITMEAPANGDYYVAGEAPLVTIVISDGDGPIDHATELNNTNFNRAYLYVNGPRAQRLPGLTSAARAEATSGNLGPWDLYDADNPPTLDLTLGWAMLSLDPDDAPAGTFADQNAATAEEVVKWLNGDAMFSQIAYATTDGDDVTILARPATDYSALTILDSGVANTLGFVLDTEFTGANSGSYPSNTFYKHVGAPEEDDPRFSWSTGNVTYRLDDVGSVPPGTYTIFVEAGSFAALPLAWSFINFNVGSDDDEPKVATNCTDCHEDTRMHGAFFAVPFDADICASCHDNRRQLPDRQVGDPADGWGANAASGRSNYGFGAAPISRRVHGVHFGHYIYRPEEVHGSYDYSHVIFPQDIRNCVKCHSESDSWAQRPARLPCLGCHDSDATKAHARLQTFDPTPWDEYNGDEMESCEVCHGPGRDFEPAVVHNIWDPFQLPYPR